MVQVKADYDVPEGLGAWATLELYQGDLLGNLQGIIMGDSYCVFSI